MRVIVLRGEAPAIRVTAGREIQGRGRKETSGRKFVGRLRECGGVERRGIELRQVLPDLRGIRVGRISREIVQRRQKILRHIENRFAGSRERRGTGLDRRRSCIWLLSVTLLSATLLNVTLLNAIWLNVPFRIPVGLNSTLLHVILRRVILLRVVWLNVIGLKSNREGKLRLRGIRCTEDVGDCWRRRRGGW